MAKAESILEAVGPLRAFISQAAEAGCVAHEIEPGLFKRLLQLGLLLLQQFLRCWVMAMKVSG